jgi:hypothetical protein
MELKCYAVSFFKPNRRYIMLNLNRSDDDDLNEPEPEDEYWKHPSDE